MNTEVKQINVDDIIPNRFQPRKNFDQEGLEELADSIRQHGIIQPLVLRKLEDKFEIIAGERRFKAANLIGLRTVPAIVMELNESESAEIALIENIQRKDLTAIEEAKSYEKILELGQMNQEELAKRVGKKQSTVSNKLRLLNLSEEAQQALLDNKISERHARSLLRLKDKNEQNNMLHQIVDRRMTVRETDNEIKKVLGEIKDEVSQDEIIDFQFDTPLVKEETNLGEINMATNNDVNTSNPIESTNSADFNNSNNINIPNIPIIDKQNENNISNNNPIPSFDNIGIQSNNINNELQNNISSQPNQKISTGGKFFNLDDEAANMNMGPAFGNNTNNTFDPTQFGNPNYNEHQINNNINNNPEIPAFGSPNPFGETSNLNNYQQESINPQPIIQRQDITGAVAVIRNTIVNLQNNGYNIEINESDLNYLYQIVINIKR